MKIKKKRGLASTLTQVWRNIGRFVPTVCDNIIHVTMRHEQTIAIEMYSIEWTEWVKRAEYWIRKGEEEEADDQNERKKKKPNREDWEESVWCMRGCVREL